MELHKTEMSTTGFSVSIGVVTAAMSRTSANRNSIRCLEFLPLLEYYWHDKGLFLHFLDSENRYCIDEHITENCYCIDEHITFCN